MTDSVMSGSVGAGAFLPLNPYMEPQVPFVVKTNVYVSEEEHGSVWTTDDEWQNPTSLKFAIKSVLWMIYHAQGLGHDLEDAMEFALKKLFGGERKRVEEQLAFAEITVLECKIHTRICRFVYPDPDDWTFAEGIYNTFHIEQAADVWESHGLPVPSYFHLTDIVRLVEGGGGGKSKRKALALCVNCGEYACCCGDVPPKKK